MYNIETGVHWLSIMGSSPIDEIEGEVMLGFYNYTVILTYIGMFVAFSGITFVFNGDIQRAIGCLVIAGICDMFDGKIASTRERTPQEKKFGIQIDSLSDLIAFGVLPSLLIYKLAQENRFSVFICGGYVLCALIRLAYFNVDEEERQNRTTECRKMYLGLPVTTVAIILPILIGLSSYENWSLELIGPSALVMIAIAFITPFPVKKPTLFIGGAYAQKEKKQNRNE